MPADARTRKTPANCRGEKPDATDVAAPPGHDDARQALGELRRIVDAERHRIRGKFIPMRNEIRRGQNCWRDTHRFNCMGSENLMTEALTLYLLGRSTLA